MFKKIFAKLKFSSALFEKIQLFVCLLLKTENKRILKLKIYFLEEQADLKTNVLMISHMLTRKCYFS